MNKSRLEAFSDGVIAIIITIMVLEFKVPHGSSVADLTPLAPVLLSYILSFMILTIYWINHHALFQAAQNLNHVILWANAHLLFWLSFIPFSTSWMGENIDQATAVGLYGANMLMCGIAYYLLSLALKRSHPQNSNFSKMVGKDLRGSISLLLYLSGALLCLFSTKIALILYGSVAVVWIWPYKVQSLEEKRS